MDLSDSHALPLSLSHSSSLALAFTAFTVLFPIVMSITAADNLENYILRSVIEHVFMPPKLPQKHPGEETEQKTNVALCINLIAAAKDFLQTLHPSECPLWMHLIKMMELVRSAAKTPLKEDVLQRALSDMTTGGTYRLLVLCSSFYSTISIRCILHAYPGTKCCSHCAQACHRRPRSVRGV